MPSHANPYWHPHVVHSGKLTRLAAKGVQQRWGSVGQRLTVEDAGAVIASKRQEGISADRPGGLAIDERADFIDSLGISA